MKATTNLFWAALAALGLFMSLAAEASNAELSKQTAAAATTTAVAKASQSQLLEITSQTDARASRRGFVDLECSSNNFRSTFCGVGQRVYRVVLLQQYSSSACIGNQTFFVSRFGMETTNGCRGLFRAFYVR